MASRRLVFQHFPLPVSHFIHPLQLPYIVRPSVCPSVLLTIYRNLLFFILGSVGALVISYRVLCRLLIFAFIFHVTCEKGTKITAYICEFRRQGASTGCHVLWPKVNMSEYTYIYYVLYIYKYTNSFLQFTSTCRQSQRGRPTLSPSGFSSSLPPPSLSPPPHHHLALISGHHSVLQAHSYLAPG